MRTDVLVVGAGLAGLACARRLSSAGVDHLVLERADAPGGRVRTDVVDGFRCDRGFQLVNPAYPEVPRVLDVEALDLRPFRAGVVVARGGRRHELHDPRRSPSGLLATLQAPYLTPRELLGLARWALPVLADARAVQRGPDSTLAESLDAARVCGRLRRSVLEPFLAGVLAESDQRTSATFAQLLVRSFVLGKPSVPASGMQALPDQLAAGLEPGRLRLGVDVAAARPGAVETSQGPIQARTVVVATDPPTAERLTEVPSPAMKGLTTWWFTPASGAEPPSTRPLLHLDGDRRGPVVNTAVMSLVAPEYAPAGRHLVQATEVGVSRESPHDAEQRVRSHLRLIYGADPRAWELVVRHVIARALPEQPPPLRPRRPVDLSGGLFVAGDHRDTASIQGALVSGRRAADAVMAHLGVARPD